MGFLYSEAIPSEVTYSRVITILTANLSVIEQMNQSLLQLINEELAIFEENVAIGVTAIEPRTKPVETENPKLPSTKEQRTMTREELRALIQTYPARGVKKNSKGKNDFWFGYKGTLAVSTKSQYILSMDIASAITSDVSLAIPTIRQTKPLLSRKKEPTCFF